MDPKVAAKCSIEDKCILALLVSFVDKRMRSLLTTHYRTMKDLWDFLQFIYGR